MITSERIKSQSLGEVITVCQLCGSKKGL